MDNKKDDKYYFKKIVDDIKIIKEYLDNATYEQLLADELSLDAIMFRLVQIGENTKPISVDFKERHPEIEWSEIVGFRNKLVHEYGKTDYSFVYEVITKDLDELKELFKQYL